MVSTRNTIYTKTRKTKRIQTLTFNNITNNHKKNLLYFNFLINTRTKKKYLNIGITYMKNNCAEKAYYERNKKELSKHCNKKIICEHIGYFVSEKAEQYELMLKQILNPYLAFYKDINGNTKREIFDYVGGCESKLETFLSDNRIKLVLL